jgi:hypothetical protein
MVRALIGMLVVAAVCAAIAPAQRARESEAAVAKGACSSGEVKILVGAVLGAFNRGDTLTFNSLIAQRPAFKWFSVGGAPGRRIRAAAFDRAGLPRYVLSRHRQGERQRLVRFRFNGRGAVHAHFDFSVIRSARDHPAERVTGKGAIDCTLQPPRIAVWSLGDA